MALAPPPSLSVRQLPRGGGVSSSALSNPDHLLKLSGRLVLLIHGYNNDQEAGRQAYEGFRRAQRLLADLETSQPITDKQFVDVYWPGDADWGIGSPLYYPWSIDKAKESAAILASALARAAAERSFKEIDIVTHSMGGRLTLELIKHLVLELGVSVRRVVFMAAAVPTFMLDPEDAQQLRVAYNAKVQGAATSLFSPNDMVLAVAFPLGQTIAGTGEGWFPTALGHDIWSSHLTPSNLAQQQVHGAGHSDYWGWNDATLDIALEANQYVREFLQFNAAGSREMASRRVADRPELEERPSDVRDRPGTFED